MGKNSELTHAESKLTTINNDDKRKKPEAEIKLQSSTSATNGLNNKLQTMQEVQSLTIDNNKENKLEDTAKEQKKEFKLRIVPLEKLLAKPENAHKLREITRATTTTIICPDSDSNSDIIIRRSKQKKQKKEKETINTSTPAEKSKRNAATKSTKKDSAENKCKKLKIKIKRLLPEQIKAAQISIAAASKGKLITDSVEQKNKQKMAEIDEKPTTSARARNRPKKTSLVDEESDWENAGNNTFNNDNDDDEKSEELSEISELNDDDEEEDEAAGNSSASEIMPVRKKRVFNKRKKSSSDDSDFEPNSKKKQAENDSKNYKKRRRIQHANSSDNSNGDDSDGDGKNKNKRKHIRKIIKTADLDISTKNAAKEEEDRRKRIEERQKLYNQIYEKPESTEVTELILDFDEDTKKTLLEVDKGILKKLKPHQVTGVKFMWDACFETLQDIHEKPGSGCILAHCMGLGKTLQIVTLTHTLLVNARRTGVERVLIISPLSTLNNWAREFHMWINFTRKKDIEVYDMSKYKDKNMRIFKLNEWYNEGGVCILGYDMYRILANEKAKGLRKKQRETLQKALVDPGPDLVVCDEGHLLKNEKTSISKAVTKMRTKRRIVLTGTPLQNNLKECE